MTHFKIQIFKLFTESLQNKGQSKKNREMNDGNNYLICFLRVQFLDSKAKTRGIALNIYEVLWELLYCWYTPENFFKNCYFCKKFKLVKDTVINVVPNADISKTHKITFFSITIISKISIFASIFPIFCQDIFECGTEPPSTKNWIFLGKMAGKDGKVTFCYIFISYLKIEIRWFLRPSQRDGLIRFYHGNR